MYIQLQPVALNYSTEECIYIEKNASKNSGGKEWDAAGEVGYVIQAAQNMRILYFNALV